MDIKHFSTIMLYDYTEWYIIPFGKQIISNTQKMIISIVEKYFPKSSRYYCFVSKYKIRIRFFNSRNRTEMIVAENEKWLRNFYEYGLSKTQTIDSNLISNGNEISVIVRYNITRNSYSK